MGFFFSQAKLLLSNYTSALASLCNARGGEAGHVSCSKGIAEQTLEERQAESLVLWPCAGRAARSLSLQWGVRDGGGTATAPQQTSPGSPLCSTARVGTLSSACS